MSVLREKSGLVDPKTEETAHGEKTKTLRQVEAVEKKLIRRLCGLIESGSIQVVFWDGTEEKHGKGTPAIKLIFRDRKVVKNLVRNPALVFGVKEIGPQASGDFAGYRERLGLVDYTGRSAIWGQGYGNNPQPGTVPRNQGAYKSTELKPPC